MFWHSGWLSIGSFLLLLLSLNATHALPNGRCLKFFLSVMHHALWSPIGLLFPLLITLRGTALIVPSALILLVMMSILCQSHWFDGTLVGGKTAFAISGPRAVKSLLHLLVGELVRIYKLWHYLVLWVARLSSWSTGVIEWSWMISITVAAIASALQLPDHVLCWRRSHLRNICTVLGSVWNFVLRLNLLGADLR